MKFIPHEYQKYAIDFIENHEIAAVLLSMGLGKTAITLTALNDLLFDRFEISRVLLIAPLRVATLTWPQEIGKWEHLKRRSGWRLSKHRQTYTSSTVRMWHGW